MIEKRYDYNPRWKTLIWATGFFGLCGVVLAHEAITNDRGVVIEHFIKLDRAGATIFYWCLAGCSALFVLAGISLAIRRIVNPQTLTIDLAGLTIPQGFLRRTKVRVLFSEIKSISETELNRQVFLNLHTDHKRYQIARSLFPTNEDYEELKATIYCAVPTAPASDGLI
jgi:hypothetical protein